MGVGKTEVEDVAGHQGHRAKRGDYGLAGSTKHFTTEEGPGEKDNACNEESGNSSLLVTPVAGDGHGKNDDGQYDGQAEVHTLGRSPGQRSCREERKRKAMSETKR